MKKVIVWLITICFLLVAVCFNPAELSAAPYYEGKVITIIVGHAPGGGFDQINCATLFGTSEDAGGYHEYFQRSL